MLREKVVARILLILSVVRVAVAAPAVVRQRSLPVDVAKKAARALESPQSQDILLPTSGAPPSQDDTSPAPEDPVHNDPLAGSGDPQSHWNDHLFRWWEHTDWRPTGEIEQGESSSQLELGTPRGPSTASGSLQLQDGPPPASETPHVQDDSQPTSGAPHVHNDDSPPTPETPRPPPVHESSGSGNSYASVGSSVGTSAEDDFHPVVGAISSSHSESEGPALAANLNHEIELLKLKVKAYTLFGAGLGFGVGGLIGMGGTMLWGHHRGDQSDGAYVSARLPPSPLDI